MRLIFHNQQSTGRFSLVVLCNIIPVVGSYNIILLPGTYFILVYRCIIKVLITERKRCVCLPHALVGAKTYQYVSITLQYIWHQYCYSMEANDIRWLINYTSVQKGITKLRVIVSKTTIVILSLVILRTHYVSQME